MTRAGVRERIEKVERAAELFLGVWGESAFDAMVLEGSKYTVRLDELSYRGPTDEMLPPWEIHEAMMRIAEKMREELAKMEAA